VGFKRLKQVVYTVTAALKD